MSNKLKYYAVFTCCLVLFACGISVPPEKSDYVGEWEGEYSELQIYQDGQVNFEKEEGNSSTQVKGPITSFEGDDFSVGIACISTTFEVSKPPYQENGRWKMVVDGEELTKIR